MSGLDKAFGVSPQVLALRTQKLNLLSANIANASTPDYKARDIDFRSAMSSAMTESSQLKRTHSAHFDLNGATGRRACEVPHALAGCGGWQHGRDAS
jgi:flagellar basal-body rod protein FlgB